MNFKTGETGPYASVGVELLYPEGGRGENRDNRAHAVKKDGKALCGSSVRVWAIDSDHDMKRPSCLRCRDRLKLRIKRAKQ